MNMAVFVVFMRFVGDVGMGVNLFRGLFSLQNKRTMYLYTILTTNFIFTSNFLSLYSMYAQMNYRYELNPRLATVILLTVA